MRRSGVPKSRDHFHRDQGRTNMSKHVHEGRKKVSIILSASAPTGPTGALARYSDAPHICVGEVAPPGGIGNVPDPKDALRSLACQSGVARTGGVLIPRLLRTEAHGCGCLSHSGKSPRAEFGHNIAIDTPGGAEASGLSVPGGSGRHKAQGSQSNSRAEKQSRGTLELGGRTS